MYEMNETHDPNLKSWVESANDPATDFPIQNLPWCTFKSRYGENHWELGVRVGDQVIDFSTLTAGQLLKKSGLGPPPVYTEDIAKWTSDQRSLLRRILVDALRDDTRQSERQEIEVSLVAASELELIVPF